MLLLCGGILGLSDRDRQHLHHLADDSGAANQLLGTLALCIATTVLIKMWKSPYLWVTAIPCSWEALRWPAPEMFWMFLAKAATLASGQAFARSISMPCWWPWWLF